MISSLSKAGRPGSRGEPEKTRAAILKAALEEFSNEDVTGARTDEIARSAGVNKALLYYYFKDKESLYAAVLEQVLTGIVSRVTAVLDRNDLAPREKLLLYAETHFDYIASSPLYPRLVQRESMRSGRHMHPLVGRFIDRQWRPVYNKLMDLLADGIQAGEFRQADPAQTLTSILGAIIFYFISSPTQQLMGPGDPFSPERIAARRAAVLDFVSTAIFTGNRPKSGSKPAM